LSFPVWCNLVHAIQGGIGIPCRLSNFGPASRQQIYQNIDVGDGSASVGADAGEAVRESREGALIDIEVQPGSSKPGRVAFDQWRRRFRLSVGAQAEKGMANAEVLSLLSGILGVPQTSLRIVSGLTDRKKSVVVAGMGADDVLFKLRQFVKGG
jgi:uncharacterized protein